jgi:serine/threonine protein kinase
MQDLSGAPHVEQVEILEILGRGGMSVVYKARQRRLDRLVALKVLSGDLVAGLDGIRRFKQEAKICSSLDHANIIRTFAFGIAQEGQPYLIMEYLQGNSLADELLARGVLRLGKFKTIFLSVLAALEKAHEAGLVHRDIKPGNIMICRTDEGGETVKLVDFGIAKDISGSETASHYLTRTGVLLGSPNYMSPEQCAGSKPDCRADLYSLACVMYEALCGQPPFSGDSALEVMRKQLLNQAPSVETLKMKTGVTSELAEAVLWGLAKNPALRPQTARELAGRLNNALEQVDPDTLPQTAGLRIRGSGTLKLLVLALGLLLIALLTSEALRAPFMSARKAEGSIRSGSLHNLEIEAGRMQSERKYAQAFACYEQAIKLLESGRLERKQDLVRVLAGALSLDKSELRPPAAKKMLEFADRGIKLCVELSGLAENQVETKDRFKDFCSKKIDLLQDEQGCSAACVAALNLVSVAEKTWGKESRPALLARFDASSAFLKCGQGQKVEALVCEGIGLAQNEDVAFEKRRLQEKLALIYAQEHRQKEFSALFDKIKQETYFGKQADLGDRLAALDTLVNIAVDSRTQDVVDRILADELKGNAGFFRDDPEYSRRLSMMYCGLGRQLDDGGQKGRALQALQTALFLSNSASDQKMRDARCYCLKQLAALYESQQDSAGADKCRKEMERLKP